MWPTAPVGGPYRSTLWPFRRLATYPSYPYRVVPPCPRTLSKFSGLATYPLGLGEVRALETYIFSRKSQHGGFQTSFLPNKPNFLRPRTEKQSFPQGNGFWKLQTFCLKGSPNLHPRPQNYDLLEELAPWNLEASKPSFSGKLRFRLLGGTFSSRGPESTPDPPRRGSGSSQKPWWG